jgi:hypothetical protein
MDLDILYFIYKWKKIKNKIMINSVDYAEVLRKSTKV